VSDCVIINILLIIEHNVDASPVKYAFYVKRAANQDLSRTLLWAGLHTLRAAGCTRTTGTHYEACEYFWE